MKQIQYLFIILLMGSFTGFSQDFDITLNSAESGTKTHQARNSITFGPNYSYTPSGGTMTAEIVNPVVSGDISYNNTIVDPETRSLSTSYMVGATKGAFNVNLIGGASYTIPFEVPPGVGGFAPNLSLSYSSNAGPGIAGYGWNLAGLSVITRSPKTQYHDGETVGVDLTNTDRFSLDGQRLICTSDNYGESFSQYRTEVDNFTRVTCYTAGDEPSWFFAETKSGAEIKYGFGIDSDQTIDGLTDQISWYIDKMTDLYGNTIEFEYIKQNGHNYIGEIKYGVNTITFYYKERSDKQTSYFAGGTLEQNLILHEVEMKYNSTVVKKYELKYNYNYSYYNNSSVLNEVIEYGVNGSRYNSTAFSYEYQTGDCNSYPFSTYNSYISTNYTQYPGDFNGDGRTDILTVNNSNKKSWRLYLATEYGDFTYQTSGTVTFDIHQVIATDLNGDGKDDLMLRCFVDRGYYYPYGVSDFYQFYYAISYGTSIQTPQFFTKEYYSLSTLSGVKIENSILENSSTDFDGDGLEDMFVRSNSSWKVFGFSFNGTSLSFSEKNSGSGTLPGDELRFGDFNGDGKMDLYTFDANGLKIYAINGNSLTTLYSNYYPNKDHHFKMGDFNGDGKTDIFVYGYSSSDWTIWQLRLSTGTGFRVNYFASKKTNLKDDNVYTGDFNGDGRTDILALSENISGNPRQYYFVTKPNATDVFSQFHERSEYDKDRDFTLGDFDGNGKTDIIVPYSTTRYYTGLNDGKTNILLSRIADGLNNTNVISYRKLSGQYSNYEKGSANDNFPVFTYQGPLTTVDEWHTNNGQVLDHEYSYKGLKIHRQGKGFLGYEQVIVEDPNQGTKTETNKGYDDSYFYPTVLSVKNYTNATLVNMVENTWDEKVTKYITGVDPIFPYISSSTQNNSLTGHSVTSSFTFDSYGNATEIEKVFDNGVKETATNTYTNDETNWLLGKLNSSKVDYEKSGETTISNTVSYTYSTDGKLKPDFIRSHEGSNWYYRKNHDYDSKGNLTQLYEQGYNVSSKSTNYTYEANGIRVKTISDPSAHVTEMFYDTYGRLSSEEDFLDNTTSYGYDNMGRTLTETLPDGFVATTAYIWGIDDFTNSCYYIQQSGNDGSLAKTWYDKMGRKLRNDVKGFSGSIYTNTGYDTKGRLWKVYEPSTTTTSTPCSTYSYDSYGRITGITRPSGNNTTYSYNTNKVTETTSGKISWKETNSMGLVTTAHDNGGDITYTYYPDGAVKTILPAGGSVTTMEYDEAGNQKKLIDPSAGTLEYTYNAYRQLNSQKNGRGQTTSYTYLADGRLDKTNSPEGETSYAYNSNEQLTGISNTQTNVSRAFAYDSKGRVNSISETIPGITSPFITTFTFDNKGRLSTRTHPSGIEETNNYNNNGYLFSISAGGATQWTVTSMNARQQITGTKHGTSLLGEFGYDNYGFPIHIKAKVGSTYRQDYRYSFTASTGNLDSRENFLKSKTETFTYDNLFRLKTVSGPQNLTMNYADNGNISEKSDVGNVFAYEESTKPYQLTGLETSSGLVSDVQQDITYTSFEQPSVITESPYMATFTYNSDGQRAKMEVKQNSSTVLTRWYVGSRFTEETAGSTTKELTWIGGDAYSAPCIAIKTNTGSPVYYYLLRDHLGTITHVTNTSGTVLNEYSFDAWGRQRNFTDWGYTVAAQTDLLPDRGFTGHEYLPEFKLYNMNGRLYDPVVGRFLSPDNNVQMPSYTQNFNRYSYCLNNPLIYTDPSGESIIGLLIASAIQQAIVGGARANLQGENIGRGALKGAITSTVTTLVAGGMGLLAPGFNSTGVLLGNKFALVGKYLGKASYATLTGFVAAGAGMLAGDIVDNGGIDISGSDYLHSMTNAGLVSGGISMGASAYKYATWDRFSLDRKVEMLQTKFNTKNLELDLFSKGYGYTKNGMIYITPLGLENKSISDLTIFHEQYHISDINKAYPRGSIPNDPEMVINILENRAHLATLKASPQYNIPSRYWMNSKLLLRNTYNYSGSLPKTLGAHHILNNLFY